MSDLKLPGEEKKNGGISQRRIVIWVVVGAVGAYLLLSGVIGILTPGP